MPLVNTTSTSFAGTVDIVIDTHAGNQYKRNTTTNAIQCNGTDIIPDDGVGSSFDVLKNSTKTLVTLTNSGISVVLDTENGYVYSYDTTNKTVVQSGVGAIIQDDTGSAWMDLVAAGN